MWNSDPGEIARVSIALSQVTRESTWIKTNYDNFGIGHKKQLQIRPNSLPTLMSRTLGLIVLNKTMHRYSWRGYRVKMHVTTP
nr:hypothetical protein [Oxalobacteraceae bacterium]